MFITTDIGVHHTSEMFFSSTTQTGMELFYYPICAGHYYCNKQYVVERKQHYSILVMQIIQGACSVETEFSSGIAKQGDTVIIDCWLPHRYKAIDDKLEMIWVHIDGGNCRQLCKAIVQQNGNVLHTDPAKNINGQIENIYHIISNKQDCPEAVLSSHVYSLFCNCFLPQYEIKTQPEGDTTNSVSAMAKGFIHQHLNRKITVKEIAGYVHLSSSQFSKLFKKQTGFSPYDYVLVTRLTRAKEYLLETDLTISEIALQTGFLTDCNFTTFFSSCTGMSPTKFRNEHQNR